MWGVGRGSSLRIEWGLVNERHELEKPMIGVAGSLLIR